MSFGFGVGDILNASQLAFTLWKYCYKVARDAPEEFKLLVGEISTLSHSITFLGDEVKDPNSTLMRGGEDRIRMMCEMMACVTVTLNELQKIAEKYDKLGNLSRGRLKQAWTKFKWSVDASDLDALRNKLVYHNGIISLLLISCGNSSLQRIEAANVKLERRFSEIGDLIQNLGNGAGTSSEQPTLSAVDAKSSKMAILQLNAALMKTAEIGQRKWSSIGVDEWIQAGRWWLMKAQMTLAEKAENIVSQQGYLDLIKASWILTDVIARHPQLNLLDSGIRCEVELLAESIRNALEDIDTSGHQKPELQDLLTCDLHIWETQLRGPALQPSLESGSSTASNQLWMATDEHVLFQRFGQYHSSRNATPTPCIVLLMAHKTTKKARIVLGNQSWITVEQYSGVEIAPVRNDKTVQIDAQKIELATSLDARLVCVMWRAVGEYMLHLDADSFDYEIFTSFVLLLAVQHNYRDVVQRILRDGEDPVAEPNKPFSARLLLLSRNLASGLLKENDISCGKEDTMGLERSGSAQHYVPLFVWAGRMRCDRLISVLLDGIGVIKRDADVQQWYSWEHAFAIRNMEVMQLFLSQTKADLDRRGRINGPTLLQAAAGRGYEAMVDQLMRAGVDINANPGLGQTSLQAAAGGGHEGIVCKLLTAGAKVNAAAGGSEGRTALQAAAGGGHEAIVRKLLTAGAKVNAAAAGDYGRTVLQVAAKGGHETVISAMLAADAEVNADAGDSNGRTALQAAAEGGHETVVNTLLAAGAKVNATAGVYGRTALQAAAGGGHETVVNTLLTAGAEVNADAGDSNGRTALQAAAGGGHETVVNTLLTAGAKVNADAGNWYGRTALQAAAGGGHETVVNTLLTAGAKVNATAGDYGRTALQAAAGGGHETVVNTLLTAGAEVNADAGDFNGRTALQAAAGGGHETVVNTLLTAGAEVNADAGNWYGRTALQVAAGGGHETVVNTLLTAGAEVNAAAGCFEGRTALQAAAEGGHETVVNTLLTAGANVNVDASEWNGRTALQAAAGGGHETVVKTLLTAGAKVNATAGDYGRTALQAAAGGGHETVVNTLLTAGAEVNADAGDSSGRTALQAAAEGGHETVVNTLLAAGAKVNATAGVYGRTALQAAAGGGHETVVNTLLTAGAEVNADAGDSNGRTALQAAAEGGHETVVNTLLTAGAKVNAAAAGVYGRTALQAAAGGGHETVVNTLLTAGAEVNVDAGDSGGRTALQAAAEGGHETLVSTLLRAGAEVNASISRRDTRTAVELAIERNFQSVVKILRAHGAI